MPLSRFQLRNEYGLGVRELYSESSKAEDPKGVLDGVAVAGLVGLLRQIGDLTEFAAEVFHELQEEVATTASRSRNLTTRMKRVEAALSPLEKAMLSQTSHLHFAYTPGSEWHVHIKNEQNHLIHTDLPRCIMDSYEESREPPCLQLLDRFDAGGPGSCLKRYSDPSFFRRASGNFVMPNDGKSKKGRKGCKVKKRKSWKQSSQLSRDATNFGSSGRLQFSSPSRQRQSSPTQTVSTFDMTFKSDLADQSDSLDSGDGMGCIESAFRPSALTQSYVTKTKLSLCGSKYPEEHTVNDGTPRSSTPDKTSSSLSVATCDDKVETFEPMVPRSDIEEIPSVPKLRADLGSQKMKSLVWKSANDVVQDVKETNIQLDEPDIKPEDWNSKGYQNSEVQKTNLVAEDTDIQPIHQISWSYEIAELPEKSFEDDEREMESGRASVGNKTSQVHDAFPQHHEQRMDREIDRSSVVLAPVGGADEFSNLTHDKNHLDEGESETDNFVDALNTIESESENDLEYQTKGGVGLSLHPKHLEDDVNYERMTGNMGDHSLVSESPSTSHDDSDKRNSSTLHVPASSLVSTGKKYFPHTYESRHDSGREPNGIPETLLSSLHSAKGVDATKQEFAGGEFPSSEFEQANMKIGIDKGFAWPSYISDQPSVKSSNARSTALWTNGGILGLLPSKPPVVSTSNGVNTDNSIIAGPLYQNLRSKDGHLQGQHSTSGCNTGCDFGNTGFKQQYLFSGSHEVDYSKKLLQISNSVSDGKLDSSFGSSNSQGQLVPSLIYPEGKPHSASDVRDSSNEAVHVNEARPSLLSGLTHGPLIKGIGKTRSIEYDETPKTVGLLNTNDLKNGPHDAMPHSSSSANVTDSAPPSPPIGHMKLSFHPINSSDTSKLELKYPEEIDDNDDGDDDETLNLYPSCELVPKRTVQQILDSDSDDDTFCRSNPCKSDDDDDLSHPSESISELWESGYSSESKDHVSHSGLQRISSGESISSSLDHEQTDNMSMRNGFGSSLVQHDQGLSCASSKSLPEIPVSRATNSLGLQQIRVSYNPNVPMMPFDLPEIAPGTPPLPPLQWRLSKPRLDASEVKQSTMNLGRSQSMNPHRDEKSDDGNVLMNDNLRNKYMDEKLKVNTEEKAIQASKGRRVDEKGGDFLHQIRAKSFNLRKTGLLKPNPQPVTPAAYDKITAILEKANAIRQAVGSDGGEDDDEPWSDT